MALTDRQASRFIFPDPYTRIVTFNWRSPVYPNLNPAATSDPAKYNRLTIGGIDDRSFPVYSGFTPAVTDVAPTVDGIQVTV
jgi:hypothetical protein